MVVYERCRFGLQGSRTVASYEKTSIGNLKNGSIRFSRYFSICGGHGSGLGLAKQVGMPGSG